MELIKGERIDLGKMEGRAGVEGGGGGRLGIESTGTELWYLADST